MVSGRAHPQPGRSPPGGPPTSPPLPSPAEKVTSLGKDWHRPCLRCERCGKTLTPGGHAEVRGAPAGRLGAGRAAAGDGRRGRGVPGGGRCPLVASLVARVHAVLRGVVWRGGAVLPSSSPKVSRPGQGFENSRVQGDPEEAIRGSGECGLRGPRFSPPPHLVPSTTASLTATSPATEYFSDPRVSVARRVWDAGSPFLHPSPTTLAPLPTGVNTGAVGSYIYDKDPEGKVQP